VGIWSPNRAEWLVTQFATARAGLVLVNINPAYRMAELEYALNKVGLPCWSRPSSFKTSDYLGMLQRWRPSWPPARPGAQGRALPQLRTVDGDPHGRRGHTPGMLRYDDLLAAAAPGDRARSTRRTTCRCLSATTHQHPVHQRHHRAPRAPRSRTTTW
jgi:fatty-acyl-CoA synthase